MNIVDIPETDLPFHLLIKEEDLEKTATVSLGLKMKAADCIKATILLFAGEYNRSGDKRYLELAQEISEVSGISLE